ncbi:MAG: ATP-dependent DNA helicase RecG [Candidatus Omnitrophota bacterium]
MNKPLATAVRYLKGIGPKKAGAISSLGINDIEDLLYYFPRRYEDRTSLSPIAELKQGEAQTVKAAVLAASERQSLRRRSFRILEVAVGDKSGKIFCVWFNQPYLAGYFKPGVSLILHGRIDSYAGRLQMNSPEFEILESGEDDALNTGRIVPVYSLPSGITQRSWRQTVKLAIDEYLPGMQDFLSYDIRSRNNLLNLAKSIVNIHFPQDAGLQKEAYRRLAFEEFFIFQLPLALRKSRRKEKHGIAHLVEGSISSGFIAGLPFELTKAQKSALGEIKADMASARPMQRLLQGDVGSGKTVVATAAALIAVQGGYQAAMMVPTEILARQHYEKINAQVSGLKGRNGKIKIAILVSGMDKKAKERIYRDLGSGKIDLVIGTHALLKDKLRFSRLGMVVIDEQHKFGVGQRALLPAKGAAPDVLIMTATPIPRTLAITLYGDLDISVINELPSGRLPVETLLFAQDDVRRAYELAREQLKKGYQVYIIYPVIEESYALDIAGARKMYEELRSGEFKEFRLGLIHGRLKQKEQDEIMRGFQGRQVDVLVSTTVLEVGIDVANATCMIVEHAERFGLSQLHQLRGRVGRGSAKSLCILVSDSVTAESRRRLEAMVRHSDGFRLSEEDLKLRGPGEFFGRRQHGLSELRIGNPLSQMQLLRKAREEALKLVEADPSLVNKQNAAIKEKLLERFPEYQELVVVG